MWPFVPKLAFSDIPVLLFLPKTGLRFYYSHAMIWIPKMLFLGPSSKNCLAKACREDGVPRSDAAPLYFLFTHRIWSHEQVLSRFYRTRTALPEKVM